MAGAGEAKEAGVRATVVAGVEMAEVVVAMEVVVKAEEENGDGDDREELGSHSRCQKPAMLLHLALSIPQDPHHRQPLQMPLRQAAE